jgi:hypothetical protein
MLIQFPHDVGQWLVFVAVNGGGDFHVGANV